MTREEIALIVDRQRGYFASGATLPVERRIDALTRLRDAILSHEADIAEALYNDLGKSTTEGYMCETGMVLSEINYMLRHIRAFAKEKPVATPLVQFASRSACSVRAAMHSTCLRDAISGTTPPYRAWMST